MLRLNTILLLIGRSCLVSIKSLSCSSLYSLPIRGVRLGCSVKVEKNERSSGLQFTVSNRVPKLVDLNAACMKNARVFACCLSNNF